MNFSTIRRKLTSVKKQLLLLEHPQSKSKGYGQHGELQQAEIVKWVLTGCMRVAASHFSCLWTTIWWLFNTIPKSREKTKRKQSYLEIFEEQTCFTHLRLFSKMKCMKAAGVNSKSLVANSNILVRKSSYFGKWSFVAKEER